jgi:hypothetical protein
VLKARSAFLSNYEVYALLKEMESKQLEQTRAFMAIKKEENLEDQYKGPNFVVPEEVAENVRTIQVEVNTCSYVSFFHFVFSVSLLVGSFARQLVYDWVRINSDILQLLQYLNGDNLPTSKQNAESVAKLTRGLRDYGLTKAERLQIVNLYPQSVLDLYVVSLIVYFLAIPRKLESWVEIGK